MSKLIAAGADCTARLANGRFCDRQSLPGAPFPVCLDHAARLLRFLNDSMQDSGTALRFAREVEDEMRPDMAGVDNLPSDGVGVVYYMRVGQYIKIGHTVDLRRRFRFYPPDTEVLAYEFGDRSLERRRLDEFAGDLRKRNEWHHPSDALMAHIEQVRSQQAA